MSNYGSYEQAIQDGIKHVEMLERTLRTIRREAKDSGPAPYTACCVIISMVNEAVGDE
jgi:hypothetical protein